MYDIIYLSQLWHIEMANSDTLQLADQLNISMMVSTHHQEKGVMMLKFQFRRVTASAQPQEDRKVMCYGLAPSLLQLRGRLALTGDSTAGVAMLAPRVSACE